MLLDTHVLHWWTSARDQLTDVAARALTAADEIAVSAISWYELAWLAAHERIVVPIPHRSWLEALSSGVFTSGITPAIASIAASLPASFPGDPADRLIYATSLETGWPLVTKDRRLREHRHPSVSTVW